MQLFSRSNTRVTSMLCLVAGFGLNSCKTSSLNTSGTKSQVFSRQEPWGERPTPRFCAAIRGNGQNIITHFTSLARLVEHYGRFDTAMGGSSASITTFLYESMLMNPALPRCPEGPCSEDEISLRLSLMLKSALGYIDAILNTDEATAIKGVAEVVARVKASGFYEALRVDPADAVEKLRTVLHSPDVQSLVNPEIFAMLQDPSNLRHNLEELSEGLRTFGSFSTDDARLLFRPGIISFAALAEKVGRVGSFYAGYGPYDALGFEGFLGSCAADTRGLPWSEIAAKRFEKSGLTCGDLFSKLIKNYRTTFLQDEANIRSRIDDVVGAHMPALIMTSVLEGREAVKKFRASLKNFRNGRPLAYHPNFSDVRFGYWGQPRELDLLAANPLQFNDLKTRKFISLGTTTWRDALTRSPAEPGLARVLDDMGDDRASSGGWSDLHPMLAARTIGCETIVYVTRRGEESQFAVGLAGQLGMTEAEKRQLYDLDNPNSSFSLSLRQASAVWCTNWNSFKDTEQFEMAQESYTTKMESIDPFFTGSAHPYPGLVPATNLRGCTPGAPAMP